MQDVNKTLDYKLIHNCNTEQRNLYGNCMHQGSHLYVARRCNLNFDLKEFRVVTFLIEFSILFHNSSPFCCTEFTFCNFTSTLTNDIEP